jgi:hypothetical protein
MKKLSDSPLLFFLEYEVKSSRWAYLIGWDWLQKISGRYFAWKVSRKYARYKQAMIQEEIVSQYIKQK